MEDRGTLAADPRRAGEAGTSSGGSRGDAFGGSDRQSIGRDHGDSDGKKGGQSEPTVGYDAGKQVKGRKRHLLVDTQGRIFGLLVTPADVQDRDGAKRLLEQVKDRLPRLSLLWADGSYAASFVEWAKETLGWMVEIVRKLQGQQGFQVLPRRWVVERTFAWFGKYRQLSKDYERLPESSEAMIYIAMIHRLVRRLCPP